VRHPLQPFDERNFERGLALVPGAELELRPGDAARRPGADRRGGVPRGRFPGRADLPPLAARSWSSTTSWYFRRPAGAARFLRSGSGSASGDYTTESRTRCRVELTGLAKWKVGERLLQARCSPARTGAPQSSPRSRAGDLGARSARPRPQIASESSRSWKRIVRGRAPEGNRVVARRPRARCRNGRVLTATVAGRGSTTCCARSLTRA